MFTKKHYKAIAEMIQTHQPNDPQENDYCHGKADGMFFLTRDLADYFAKDNPRFDREKFLAACGELEAIVAERFDYDKLIEMGTADENIIDLEHSDGQ